ncbi:hypothetical protein OIU85_005821 [Salix viminalis]|uniref:Inositol oxygenase n=1 Tax=Salix viminalis TaxID=40686 RepID=A0A9Q0PJR4_SALVM|nr:hypothetical protein OIU85_005821 [Salix viminalis]
MAGFPPEDFVANSITDISSHLRPDAIAPSLPPHETTTVLCGSAWSVPRRVGPRKWVEFAEEPVTRDKQAGRTRSFPRKSGKDLHPGLISGKDFPAIINTLPILLTLNMTILCEHPPAFGVELEEKNIPVDQDKQENELVLDGGFVVPGTNSFGHTFRDYDIESERQKGVEEFYRTNHINQTYGFVKRMREEYGSLNRVEMSIWECCELLNEFTDESDPDLDEPQIEHLLQTAEAIRKDYPDEDWLHLTGLIHDLGKDVPSASPLFIISTSRRIQTTTILLTALNMECIQKVAGLDKVSMSWGHDDYMYLVAKENKTTLPSSGLFIIRYHSFYALHREDAYRHLMNEEDTENLKWLKIFNKYDLYSKSKVRVDVEEVKPYYLSLIEKYFPAKLRW